MANITWTKEWSSGDDGTILDGADIQNIQNDITTVVNGGLGDANIDDSAEIQESKITFSTIGGHTHDGSDSRSFPIGNHSDVTITDVADGELLSS